MTKLPSLADMEVAKDNTLGKFLGNLAKYIQVTISPLTTGGNSVHCNMDHKDVHTKLDRLDLPTARIQGHSGTALHVCDPLKETMDEVIGNSLREIVTEVNDCSRNFRTEKQRNASEGLSV